ncbi:MAG: EcsC family protein [Desulfobacterales bacterium]|nr:EcsC family protein [Desulfobacterales bacterium]
MNIFQGDIDDLRYAKYLIENQTFADRIMKVIGVPFEIAFNKLPVSYHSKIHKITHKALKLGLDAAVSTIEEDITGDSSDSFHKWCIAATGFAGGALGFFSLTVELPLSTVIMLRSIADIARSEGENLSNIETRLSCLEVFAFGSKSNAKDEVDTSYYAVRAALAKIISEASEFIIERGVTQKGVPIILRLISQIASRFDILVSQKAVAMTTPVVGAITGATINTIFMNHFQNMARGHFIIRRLERHYGKDEIQLAYESI